MSPMYEGAQFAVQIMRFWLRCQCLSLSERSAHPSIRLLVLMRCRNSGLMVCPMRTFHGGILASFGKIVAALFVRESEGLEQEPSCSSMTFDYLRPAFAGITLAVPKIVRASKRFIVVSVDIFLDETIVSIGRFIYKR